MNDWEFTAEVAWEYGWYQAKCVELPRMRGKGRTEEEAVEALKVQVERLLWQQAQRQRQRPLVRQVHFRLVKKG